MYCECNVCNGVFDDGGFVAIKEKRYFICLDCLDKFTDEEIEKMVEERKNKNGIYL